ncbi:hypothetical protein Tco_0894436 [Tanacetum coccineum]|uniref:Uncharacterized protein n=1 Tax=Tanacetum coccineum TaxID=301880 RepID=A0ABQ5CD18_9ASTR
MTEVLAKLQDKEYDKLRTQCTICYVFLTKQQQKITKSAETEIRIQVFLCRDPAGHWFCSVVSGVFTSAGSTFVVAIPAGSHLSGPFSTCWIGDDSVSLVPLLMCGMDQFFSGIFTSSSYDDDFRATLTNLAPAVEVNPVPTKRVNTIHPQSQILGDLASPVLTRKHELKIQLEPTSIAKALEDPDWVDVMQEEMQ